MFENTQYAAINTANETESSGGNRRRNKTVERVAEAKLPTDSGEFRIIGYRSTISDEEFVVLARGTFDKEKPALVRIHSQCLTGDVFGSTKCDCGQQLRAVMKLIAEAGCGAIVYQQQEGSRHRNY